MESPSKVTVTENTIKALQEFINKEHEFHGRIIYFKDYVLKFFLDSFGKNNLDENEKNNLEKSVTNLAKTMDFSLYEIDNKGKKKLTEIVIQESNFSEYVQQLHTLIVASSNIFQNKIDAIVEFIKLTKSILNKINEIKDNLSTLTTIKKQWKKKFPQSTDFISYFQDFIALPFQHMGRYKILFESIYSEIKKSDLPELQVKINEIIGRVTDICQKGNAALGHDSVSRSITRLTLNDKNLIVMPVAKILLPMAAYYQMPLGLSFLAENNIKLFVKLKLEKNIQNFSKEILSLYFVNPAGAKDVLDKLIQNVYLQNRADNHMIFFKCLHFLNTDKPTLFDAAFERMTESDATNVINKFTIQFLTSIFLSYSAKQLKTIVPDKVKVRRDKIQAILAELNKLYELSPQELDAEIQTALNFEISSSKKLPQYLIELIRRKITFGGSIDKSLLKSHKDFKNVFKEAADFLSAVLKSDPIDVYNQFFRLVHFNPQQTSSNSVVRSGRPEESPHKKVEYDLAGPVVASSSSSHLADVQQSEDPIIPSKSHNTSESNVKPKKIRILSSKSIEMTQKIASFFALIKDEPVWHEQILAAITQLETAALQDSVESSAKAFQQTLSKLVKVIAKTNPALANKLEQMNKQQDERLIPQLEEFARIDIDSSKIVANLLRVASYYLNTSLAGSLIEQLSGENKEPNDIHKRWQPQLSQLIQSVIGIYQNPNAVFKKQKILHLLKQTIEKICGTFRGKNSRLANTLNELFYSATGFQVELSDTNKLPKGVLQLSLSEQDYQDYINSHPMSNSDNSQLVARLLIMLDYFRNNHFSKIHLRKLNQGRADVQQVAAFPIEKSEWAINEANELGNFAVLAYSQKTSQKHVLLKIDELIKKLQSTNLFMPENHKILCASLSKLSSEYGGASIYRSGDVFFPEEIMAEKLDKQGAEDYISYHRCHQNENENWTLGNDNKKALVDMAYIIILSSVYQDHSFGLVWLNDKKDLRRNKTRQGWSQEADALATKMLRLYEAKPKEPRQHVFLNAEDIKNAIRKKSFLNFWGGVNSRYANSLEDFLNKRNSHRDITNLQHDKQPEFLNVGFDFRMDAATAEDIIIRYAVHRVIDILSNYSNLMVERLFTNTSKEKADAVENLIQDFRHFTDTATSPAERKQQIDEAGGISQFVINTVKSCTHVSGGFHPIFKEGAFGEMLFGEANSLATFLRKISPDPCEDQSPALCSPSYQL